MDLGISWIEWLWFRQRAHLILVTVVLFYASQDLVILFPIWACIALVTLVLTRHHWDLDTLFHTWSSL